MKLRLQKIFFLLITCICCTTGARAQEEFITPAQFLTKFDFRVLSGGVVILQAKFGSFNDTLNFILDTGSGGISLDSTTAAYFELKPEPSNRTIRGIAGIKNVSFLNNMQLHFPGLTVDSLNFHINDYSILTTVYGERIDGIIGYSVLSRYIVKIDYDSTLIEFWSQGAIKYPKGGYLLKPFISTLPMHEAKVRDAVSINTRFLYDMGAGLNLMLSTDFVRDSAILLKKRKLYVKQAEGLGGAFDLNLSVIKEIKLGPYKFKNVPVYIFDDEYNVTNYPNLGGIIGNDLLRRFNVILNYEKRDIYLKPNKHFSDPFDYSYTGLELYFIEDGIIIGDVAKDSPAEKAGLKEGDYVIAINKNFSGDMQQFKNELQYAGQKVKLIIKRDGELMGFEFKTKNILRR